MVDSSSHSPSDPGIALALGAAFLGVYAHSGFLCGLNQAGIFPGHVAGSSAGAMAGGFYASGIRGNDLEEVILSAAFKRSFPDLGMLLRWVPMLALGRLTGIMNGKRMIKYLKRELPIGTIEECIDVKFSIAVTDLRNFQGRFLTGGPLAESMMASCSVPVLFTEQEINGMKFHDGGVLHALPFELFANDPEVHTIIIHNVVYPITRGAKNLSVQAAFANSHQLLNDALLGLRRKEAERNGKRVIVIETEHPHPGIFQSKVAKKHYFDEGHRTGLSIKRTMAL